MSAQSVGVKIWAKAVFFNAFFFGIGMSFKGEIWGVFFAFILLFGGLLVSLPLLLVIVPLVRLSVKLPYRIPARITFLTFFLILLSVLFHMLLSCIIDDSDFSSKIFMLLMWFSIFSVVVAVITTRKSLYKLNTYEQQVRDLDLLR